MATARAGNLGTDIWGATGKLYPGSQAKFTSGTVFQFKNGKIIVQKKTIRRQKTSKKQLKQREKFCDADNAYRQLTQQQKNLFRQYTTWYNRKYKTHYSVHTLWMKLAMTNSLNEFFKDWLGWDISELTEEEKENEICFTAYVQKKNKTFLDEDLFLDIGATRR